MSEQPDQDQKTEAPTQKRVRDAREKGDVLQSRDLGGALVVLAGAAWFAVAGAWAMGALGDMVADALSFDARDIGDFQPGMRALTLIVAILLPLGSLLALTMAAAILGPALLGSLGFRSGAMAFKADRMNPISGVKRMFGLQGVIELGKSLAKVIVLGAVGYLVIEANRPVIFGLAQADPREAIADIGAIFAQVVLAMAGGLAVIALADVPLQWLQRARKLRMSKQEIKEEHKQTEGSPELKAALRRRQYEMARTQTRGAIAESTVVLVNPAHFAVALRYRPGTDAAPVVVARGRGVLAQAIRDLAAEGEVPVLRYPLLARAIYFTARAGDIVRDDLFVAVASVLAFVFNLDAALAAGRAQPDVDVPEGARFDEDGRPIV
ncbi:flagellar biosynthesis protein FlhB [Sphingomonas gilva]|uniref:Flagellar biosynthesis protein FlhB n=1 Tax=Sphingomonas gilva TaxID=2305907 RepID=A0A396RXK6_9SPHN|nr:flagellar type III secretion system protein FlhB [Sphingomonas gilva]RHW18451.1 flagellar biosynthesis protein FlhB [Sphingomonas gilva]